VVSNTNLVENTFTSSGTGLTTSKHLVTDTSIYTESYQKDFQFYGNIEDYGFGFTTILPGKGRIVSNLYGRRFNSVVQS
jgi:hypothetical protein